MRSLQESRTQTILFTGYAGVLLVAAYALDRCAQRSHTRSCPHEQMLGPDITRSPHTWPRTEAARFRRGLALLLIGLAALQLLVTVVRHPHLDALAVTTAPLTAAALLGYRVAVRFRRTPTGFPAITAGSSHGPSS